MIFSGRKGSGKSANYFRLGQILREDPAIRVCRIKPLAYDLDGVYELYQTKLSGSAKLHIVETLWKFLIYTELAFDVYKNLQLKPSDTYTQAEKDIFTFVDRTDFIKEDFTIRLDNVIRKLYKQEVDPNESVKDQREIFSNILHENVIAHLRIYLGNVLVDKSRVYVLIDNLDKAWVKSDNLRPLAQFLFGLLNIVERISIEFQVGDSRKQSVPLAVVVFIRSDILEVIRDYSQERDKLRITMMDWKDETMLLRVIENRFKNSIGGGITSKQVWEKYFPRNMNGMSTKQYLLGYTLPRPRDLIYLCKQCLFHAILSEHTRIEQDDISKAQIDYSNYVYERLVEETVSQFSEIKIVLRKFLNAEEILMKEQIIKLVDAKGLLTWK
jgi:hypothetical protein